MKTIILLAVINTVCESGVSAVPLNVTDSLSSSGGKATSTNYSDKAAVGDFVEVCMGAGAVVALKLVVIGMLDMTRSLAVSAAPAAVVESGTTELSALATMEDDSPMWLGGLAFMETSL
jgi:hypothetical protein